MLLMAVLAEFKDQMIEPPFYMALKSPSKIEPKTNDYNFYSLTIKIRFCKRYQIENYLGIVI